MHKFYATLRREDGKEIRIERDAPSMAEVFVDAQAVIAASRFRYELISIVLAEPSFAARAPATAASGAR